MNVSDEELMAYVDGELDAAARAAVEQAMRDDPQVARRVDAERSLRAQLGSAFRDVLDEPVPDRLMAAARAQAPSAADAKVVPLARTRDKEPASTPGWRRGTWLALAACLVAGIAIGLALPVLRASREDVRVASDGALIAGGELAMALETRLSTSGEGGVHIGLTFDAKDGRYCRTFTTAAVHGRAGVACRTQTGWRIEALEQSTDRGDAGDYRMAGSSLPPPVRAAVDSRIQGEAFDAAREMQAIRSGWSRGSGAQ